MPYNLHPIIDDARINLSRHEFAHWWLSELCGFAPGDIMLLKGGGFCSIAYSMRPDNFAEAYERSPISAASALTRILATVRVGCYVELLGGQAGQELRGRDLDDTQAWREAVVPLYGVDGWNRLYASMFQSLQTWYRRPGVQAVFREAAPAIARQERISRYNMLSLLEVAGAGSVPDPSFDSILTPPQRSPAPTSRQPVSPRRPGVAAPPKGQRAGYNPVELESRGAYGLFKLTSKNTSHCFFVISKDAGTDRQGQLILDTWEYEDEHEARREFARLA